MSLSLDFVDSCNRQDSTEVDLESVSLKNQDGLVGNWANYSMSRSWVATWFAGGRLKGGNKGEKEVYMSGLMSLRWRD